MSDFSKAVFLSYASQDAEAAQRICEALRAAGVEVWFDQNELVGGDAWDQKIRRQIKECALFVPVISANTQARREGYFRLEWRLADQRTHLMAKGLPFLLPVVIDETRDADAHVPDSFTEVQWTRLRPAGYGGQARPPDGGGVDLDDASVVAFCARVQHLLLIGVAPVSDRRSEAGSVGDMGAGQRPALTRRRSPMVMIGSALAVLVAIGGAVWMSRKAEAPTPAPASSVEPVVLEQGAIDDARLRALQTASREEVALAEVSTRRAAEKDSASAQAWSAAAIVQAIYIIRGWDAGEKRRQDTQTFARRALSINPQDNRAFRALAIVLINQGAYQEAETLARRALAARPDDDAASGELASALSGQGKPEEAIVLLEESARRFPKNTGPHYTLGLLHVNKTVPDFEAALRHFETALALREDLPANALLHKAALLAGARGDFVAARATLDQISALDRLEDRSVGTAMMLSLLERQPARVLTAGGLTARDYFEDLYVHGPKAWRLAQAYRLDRKDTLARQEWQRAEAVLRHRLTANPANAVDHAALAATLAWLDRGDEAATLIAPVEAAVRESPPRVIGFNPDHLRLLYLAYYYAGRADAAQAVPYIRRLLNRRELLTDKTLPFDPWWDKIRDQPEFRALLSEAKARVAGSAASAVSVVAEKSVAVLAFRQLSADPENEYLCEAISDELCNVLGRVPGLKVAASASAFSFKGKRVRPAEMAAQLGVAYLVDGTVQKIGNRVRVRAQLIKAADESPVWSSANLDHEMKDMFAVQDEVVGAIAKNLQLQLGAGTARAAVAVNPEAFRLYYEGRRAWNLRSPEGFARAEALFNQAIAVDPNFAQAYVGLVDVWELSPGPKDHAKAMTHVQRALAIDPDLADAHATLGSLQQRNFADFRSAEASFRTAIKLNPNYASAYQWLGRFLEADGRLEEALAMERKAVELDPLSSRIADNYGRALWMAGRAPEALVVLERAMVLVPENDQARCWRAWVLLIVGRKAEALEEAPRLAALPGSLGPVFASRIFYAAGLRREGDAAFAKVGSMDGAHELLTAAVRGDDVGAQFSAKFLRPALIAMFYYMPEFEGLRRDPRFLREIDAAGLRPTFERTVAERAKLAEAAKR